MSAVDSVSDLADLSFRIFDVLGFIENDDVELPFLIPGFVSSQKGIARHEDVSITMLFQGLLPIRPFNGDGF